LTEQAAVVLAERGVPCWRGSGPTPTPAVAHAVVRRRAAAGLVFTASHNPPEYQGIKLLTRDGASAGRELTAEIERRTALHVRRGRVPGRGPVGRRVDLVGPYRRDLARQLDVDALARADLHVVYDALHGAGAGVLDRVLRDAGVGVVLRRGDPDPGFGGVAPDPVPERLAELVPELRRQPRPRLGLATDGDADRLGVTDANGRVLSETEVAAVLVDHAARTGRVRRGVALSLATGSLVERVARSHGLEVERHAVGFKHLSAALLEGRADLAADESGGIAWSGFGLDKDGLLAGLLLTELVAHGTALASRLAALVRRFGPCACGRVAVPGAPGQRRVLSELTRQPPERVAGCRVLGVERSDGLHLTLRDGFLMLRISGTEPVLRVYAEAPRPDQLKRRLRAGVGLLARKSPPSC